jgi:hypothetical protein
MDGIVSLLDSKHNQFIEELWTELKQEFSVARVWCVGTLSSQSVDASYYHRFW